MEDAPNAPATKGDIEDARKDLGQQIEQLRGEMNHQYGDIVERISDAETRLLDAFYGFAQSVRERFRADDDTEVA